MWPCAAQLGPYASGLVDISAETGDLRKSVLVLWVRVSLRGLRGQRKGLVQLSGQRRQVSRSGQVGGRVAELVVAHQQPIQFRLKSLGLKSLEGERDGLAIFPDLFRPGWNTLPLKQPGQRGKQQLPVQRCVETDLHLGILLADGHAVRQPGCADLDHDEGIPCCFFFRWKSSRSCCRLARCSRRRLFSARSACRLAIVWRFSNALAAASMVRTILSGRCSRLL